MTRFCTIYAGLLAVILASGCSPSGDDRITGGSGAGNPTGKTAFSISFEDNTPAAKVTPDQLETAGAAPAAVDNQLPDASGTVFTVTGARLNVSSLSLQLPDTAVTDYDVEPPVSIEDGQVRIAGEYTFDLFSGTAYPALLMVDIPVGVYDRLQLKLWPAQFPEDTVMTGYALELTGTFDWDGRVDRPFTIRLVFNHTAVFNAVQSIEVTETDTVGVSVNLSPAGWLSDVDISGCLADGSLELLPDGSLLIDESNIHGCNDIQVAVKNAILASGRLAAVE